MPAVSPAEPAADMTVAVAGKTAQVGTCGAGRQTRNAGGLAGRVCRRHDCRRGGQDCPLHSLRARESGGLAGACRRYDCPLYLYRLNSEPSYQLGCHAGRAQSAGTEPTLTGELLRSILE
jgi:hypothetical protein